MNIEELCMKATYSMEEYLKVLEHENIFGQHDEKIKSLEFLLQNDNFKNIKIV